MKRSVGFIGGGRVSRILLQAFCNMDVRFSRVIVHDTDSSVIERFREDYPFAESGKGPEAASQDIVFIALHPPVIMDTLETLKNDFRHDAAVISLAPKINIGKLSLKISQVKNICRLIPNATSFINEGFNPVCFSPAFDGEAKENTMDLLRKLGHTFEVSEPKLEGYAIVSAMLPTYFWFQWKALEEIGIKTGLTADESEEAVYKTLTSAIDLMYTSGMKTGEIFDLIPVRPIGEHEEQIRGILNDKLLSLYEKIKS